MIERRSTTARRRWPMRGRPRIRARRTRRRSRSTKKRSPDEPELHCDFIFVSADLVPRLRVDSRRPGNAGLRSSTGACRVRLKALPLNTAITSTGELSHDPGRDADRAARGRAALQRLAASERQLLLFVAHAWGGGIRQHMNELAGLVGGECDVLLLEPAAGDTIRLSWLRAGEDLAAYFTLAGRHAGAGHAAVAGSIWRASIFIMSTACRARSSICPRPLGVPYDCTLHDYYAICPQYHLVTADGRYCGEPDARRVRCLHRGAPGALAAGHRCLAGDIRYAVARRRARVRALARCRASHCALLSRVAGNRAASCRSPARDTRARHPRRHPGQAVAGKRACTSSSPAPKTRARAACRCRFACWAPYPNR